MYTPFPLEIFPGATPASLTAALVGRTVTGAHRHGKHMWLALSGEADVKVEGKRAPTPPPQPPSPSTLA